MKKRQQLTVNLGEDHKSWLELSKSLSKRPNTLARDALKELIKDYKHNTIDKDKYKKFMPENSCSIYIRLNKFEAASLKSYATAFGYSNSRTVIAILRSVLKQEIQFTLEEKVLLKESNKELRAIGSNLNQISKRINSIDLNKIDNNKLNEFIKNMCVKNTELTEKILKHTTTVYKLINKAKRRSEENE